MRSKAALALIGAAALYCPDSFSADGSQLDAMVESCMKDSQGSDASLRSSTVVAMQALMDLANSKLPSAVKNGYNAYGKYRNSENLDKLHNECVQVANSMGSVGSAPVLPMGPTQTSFRRLDVAYLHQGDADKISAEFERQTGMKRETFLTEMANVSEQKIKRSDPMMIDKAFSRFEGFLKKIPNAEFRKNAQKNIDLVPDTMRRGMVAKAVEKLAGFFADAGPGSNNLASTITALSKDKLASGGATGTTGKDGATTSAVTGLADADPSKAGAAGADPSRDPAALDAEAAKLAAAAAAAAGGATGGTANGKNGFDGVVVAALRESNGQNANQQANGEQTIFQQVTKRIRLLTPSLTKAPN